MYLDFSGLFHQSSKDRSGQGQVRIPLNTSEWPEEWTTISYKDYPRFPKISLDQAPSAHGFFDTVHHRTSGRDFTRKPLGIKDISMLLKYSCGITNETEGGYHRAQPSGGGRYPIEVYPILFVPSDISSGVYHYNVHAHALDTLWERQFREQDVGSLFTYPWAQKASLALIITGVFRRNQMKYGERGYRQTLIEAGAIVQNAYLCATALGILCCAIDGVYEPRIEKLLDIDGYAESVICSLVLG